MSGKRWLKPLIQLDFHGGLTETTWIHAQVLWREKLLSRLPSSQDCSEDTKIQYDTKLQKYNWQNLHVTYNSKLLSWLSIRNNWYVRRFKISTWPPTWKLLSRLPRLANIAPHVWIIQYYNFIFLNLQLFLNRIIVQILRLQAAVFFINNILLHF